MKKIIAATLHFLMVIYQRHEAVRVAAAVVLVHLLLVLPWSWNGSDSKKDKNTPLAVKTVKLTPSTKIGTKTAPPKGQAAAPSTAISSPKIDSEKKSSTKVVQPQKKEQATQKPRATPPKKSTQPNKLSSSKSSTTSKADPRDSNKGTPSNNVDSKLLAKALASIGQVNINSSSISHSSGPIGDPNGEGQGSLSYEDAIAQFLRIWVKLPEYGQVKIRLKLNTKGQVIDLQTLESQSERNRHFVEEKLPKLIFPVVENTTLKQAERSFTLVLSNE